MFKILNGHENIDCNILFEIKESKITRGHNFMLVKKQSTVNSGLLAAASITILRE